MLRKKLPIPIAVPPQNWASLRGLRLRRALLSAARPALQHLLEIVPGIARLVGGDHSGQAPGQVFSAGVKMATLGSSPRAGHIAAVLPNPTQLARLGQRQAPGAGDQLGAGRGRGGRLAENARRARRRRSACGRTRRNPCPAASRRWCRRSSRRRARRFPPCWLPCFASALPLRTLSALCSALPLRVLERFMFALPRSAHLERFVPALPLRCLSAPSTLRAARSLALHLCATALRAT